MESRVGLRSSNRHGVYPMPVTTRIPIALSAKVLFTVCSGDSYRSIFVKNNSHFLFFLVEPLVRASARATPPLYGIVRGPLGWSSRVCGGYEVDIYLLCSPHHAVLLLCVCQFWVEFDLFGVSWTQWGRPDVLNPSPRATSIFSTARSIFRTLVLSSVTKISIFRTWSYRLCFAFHVNLPQPDSCCRCIASRIPQFGHPNFWAPLFLVIYVTIFSRKFVPHFSTFWAPSDHLTGSATIFRRTGRNSFY